MEHILLCRIRDVLRKGDPLPDGAKEYILYLLSFCMMAMAQFSQCYVSTLTANYKGG